MFGKIFKGVLLLMLLGLLFLIGTCVYANFIVKPDLGIPGQPDESEAGYSVYVKNTGGLLFTNDIEIHGTVEGSRIIVLHGYWELSGQDFLYRAHDLMLDEKIFGIITVRGR